MTANALLNNNMLRSFHRASGAVVSLEKSYLYINHRDDFQRQKFPIKDNAAAMTCLLRKPSLLTFTTCANRPRRHEGQLNQLATFNHFHPRLVECSLATLISTVVSTGGAADSQKLSVNSLQTIMVLSRLLRRTQRRVLRRSSAYHIDARADGFESGEHSLTDSVPKASVYFLRICRAVGVANKDPFRGWAHTGPPQKKTLPAWAS